MAQPGVSQTRLYEWLTGDDDSRMCADIPEGACQEQPRNFFHHLWAALGNKLADELSSARLVLPWLMGIIGAPVWMVGLLVPIREAGALPPAALEDLLKQVKELDMAEVRRQVEEQNAQG